MPLTAKQRGVLRKIVLGFGISIITLGLAIYLAPARYLPGIEVQERLAFTFGWDSVLVLCLVISIGRLARFRFFSPEDIDGGGLSDGTRQAKSLQAILQNTLEQTVLGIAVHLAWSFTMPLTWQAAVPAAALLFLAGRILFMAGYNSGAPARALGFALTFYPSVIMLAAVLNSLIGRIVS